MNQKEFIAAQFQLIKIGKMAAELDSLKVFEYLNKIPINSSKALNENIEALKHLALMVNGAKDAFNVFQKTSISQIAEKRAREKNAT